MDIHQPQSAKAGMISFRLGHPDRSKYPISTLKDILYKNWESVLAIRSFEYADERGNPDLLAHIIEKLKQEEDLTIPVKNIMLVPGSTGGIDMITRLFAKPRPILVESPTYGDAIQIFRDHGLQLEAIPMDDQGTRIDTLQRTLEQLTDEGNTPKILYTIPCFQNPTGVTASEQRRLEVLQLTKRYRVTIVEDDVYRDLTFEGEIPPSYFALADGEGVLRIGSFSKILSPGLRLGWLIGENSLIQRCLNCGVLQMGGGANPFSAQLVATFFSAGRFGEHIEQLRTVYRERRDSALAALDENMPNGVHWTRPRGGYFIWIKLPKGLTANVVQQDAEKRGVLVARGESFYINPSWGNQNLRLAFSFVEEREMQEGIRTLAEVIKGIVKEAN